MEKKIVAQELKGKKFNTVLEVGCQWGENLVAIRNKFSKAVLVGIDIDDEKLRYALDNIDNIGFLHGNVIRMGYEDGSFDVVFTEALFCMLGRDEIEKALDEIVRVSNNYIILVELDLKERIGLAEGGRTGANWEQLLKERGMLEITKRKLTPEEWAVNPWLTYGYVIQCHK